MAEGMQVETMTGEYPVVEVMKLGRFRVEVCAEQDPYFFNPRDWSNLGYLVADKDSEASNYALGADREISLERELEDECQDCGGDGWANGDPDNRTECGKCQGVGTVAISPFTYFQREYGATVVIPLQFADYGSGGEQLYVGRPMGPDDPHDDSDNLYLFDTPQTRKEGGCEDYTPEEVTKSLTAEARTFEQWVEGECFYIVTYGADGEVVESIGGFLGYADTLYEAESELRDKYARYLKECERIIAWAQTMGRNMRDAWVPMEVPA